MGFLRNFYDKYAGKGIWSIGFLENTIEEVVEGKPLALRRVHNPYRDRWWADPFILDVTDELIIILVEEVFYKETETGHITKLTINRQTYDVVSTEKVLSLETHLSFPCILRYNGKIYIYPENEQSGNLSIYEYDYKNNMIEKVAVICDERLADAIIFTHNGENFMTATKPPYSNGNLLEIYKYDKEKKKFLPHSQYTFEENIARNAGNFFECNGKIYRPAQECNKKYGHAISIQKIGFNQNDGFSFHEIRRILPFDKKFPIGTHTLNMYKGVIVIDHYKYQYAFSPFLSSIKRFVCRVIKR